jgi:hypothetical protein
MNTEDKATALVRATSTALIITALLQLEAEVKKPLADIADIKKREYMRRSRLWLIDELECRYEVEQAMCDWADDLREGKPSYVEALIAALPAEARA